MKEDTHTERVTDKTQKATGIGAKNCYTRIRITFIFHQPGPWARDASGCSASNTNLSAHTRVCRIPKLICVEHPTAATCCLWWIVVVGKHSFSNMCVCVCVCIYIYIYIYIYGICYAHIIYIYIYKYTCNIVLYTYINSCLCVCALAALTVFMVWLLACQGHGG